MTEKAIKNSLVEGLKALPQGDKRLLLSFIALAIVALALGLVYGAFSAFDRAGFVELGAETAYTMLSLHGITIFFYWLYFVQAAFVLILASVYTDGSDGIAWRPLAWLGLILMTAGFVLSEIAPSLGAILLYDGNPELVESEMTEAGYFYLGYILLSAGLFLVAVSSIMTTLRPKLAGKIDTWSSIAFASVAWAGMLMVSAVAGVNAFLPAMLWAFELGPEVSGYTMSWHVLFHNMHYLPLMATVVIWYVLVEVITGVESIFGARLSKFVFAMYLIFVPPTSLYHMFLEPGLADAVRMSGSLLSLFIAVPTILVFLIIVASLESHARAQGARGLFGWIGMLPWSNPAMAAIGMAVINLALGGVFSFVLIQEKLALLLSDTFFVPGYFHFLTLGTVTLTFIAALIYVIPALTGGRIWRPSVLARMPYVTTLGLLLFGSGGLVAGYMGVPRRLFDVSYEGDAPFVWGTAMGVVGVGATFMTVALAVYVYGLVRSLASEVGRAGQGLETLSSVSWGGVAIGRHGAWIGPLSVLVLIGAMYAFTALSFEILESVPIVVSGNAHGGN
jgi:cytochrome c oxidase subunit 1